jgi:deoxyribodipyrimidine photolyase-like uncharacterized protein
MQTNYIYCKNKYQKNNIRKMSYKKECRFAYLMWQILKKKMNQDRDTDRLSVGVAEFVIIGARFLAK